MLEWATPFVYAIALFLGFIPGVGAIYNGQYAKGLVHAVVFGLIGVFLVLILAVIAGLVMKIRQADRRPVTGSPPQH